MRLDQFDKLKHLVEKLLDSHREANFKLVRLQRENAELKQQLEVFRNLPPDLDEAFLKEVLTENERLKDKNQTVQTQLGELVTQLESRIQRHINGVDF